MRGVFLYNVAPVHDKAPVTAHEGLGIREHFLKIVKAYIAGELKVGGVNEGLFLQLLDHYDVIFVDVVILGRRADGDMLYPVVLLLFLTRHVPPDIGQEIGQYIF